MLNLSKNKVLFSAFILSLFVGSSSTVLAMNEKEEADSKHQSRSPKEEVPAAFSTRATQFKLPEGTAYSLMEFYDPLSKKWRFDGFMYSGGGILRSNISSSK